MQRKSSFSKSNNNDLGNLLGMLRTRAELTQPSLARLIGVSDKTIQHWENATSTPNAAHLKKLIEVYLHLSAFTGGNEQAEAMQLWEKAALNAAFDEAWFLELQGKQPPPESAAKERHREFTPHLEVKQSLYRPTRSVFFFNMPLQDPKEFYGRKSELMTVEDRTYRQASTSIIGPRKIGKTWLLNYLKLTVPTMLGSHFCVAYLDATLPSCTTVAGFAAAALEELGMHAFIPLNASTELAHLEQATRHMKANNQTPVLCIDEFEGLSNQHVFDMTFLKGLRAMAQIGLVLVVASKRPLFDIVGENGNTSGFFNIFEQLTLVPFTVEEAESFVQAKGIQAGLSEQECNLLLHYAALSGKQEWLPIRLQLVGKMLLEEKHLAEREGTNRYRPADPDYWQQFEQRLEEKYRVVIG